MCFRPSDRLPEPVSYEFNVESKQYRMNVSGDAFEMVLGGASQADLSLSATAEQYLLFTYGRLTAADGMHLGRLTVQGDVAHLEQFEVWFKGL